MSVRLDKWLWAARFYKTRAIAREMIEGGKVHYNGYRAKPSRLVELDANIKLRQGLDEKEIIVKLISENRGPAAVAITFYEETEQSILRRQKMSEQRKLNPPIHSHEKPTKKDRRAIVRFKNINESIL
ncbi:ribosome-associated heat shock protein Hsp15 [Thorsellia anophelis]|uniref:Heat shock protein 15 n=1 Tax=Thorsellia anophelis DSM 18579 TaxID=1123402 RepID=A0A1H9YUT6_9GAMM|nr:ribosome-associated heat shock protein Hsp15 [Thorsellia anophelis]SES72869.1 ribosome-associated heat shock protein Hsp15 [Thorsellia anophelis DSM 18579]